MFDNQAFDNVPTRYKGDGTGDDKNFYNNHCKDNIEYTKGDTLSSYSIMTNQTSCSPFTGNAGNLYSWPAATAGGYHEKDGFNEPNSVCPSGWQLTVNAATDSKSYYYLIRTAYNMQENNDNRIRLLPLSFIRSGYYNQGSLSNRASGGVYWSSAAYNSNGAYRLSFGSGYLTHQSSNYKNYGMSVRCVSR